jgi:hypothetical protein
MFGRILTRLGLGTIHRRPGRQPKEAHRRPILPGTPGEKRQPMDFDAASLHQDDTLMHIDKQVRLQPRGQFDFFLEDSIRFLDGLPLAGRLKTLRGRPSHKADPAERGCESERDEILSVTQVRK